MGNVTLHTKITRDFILQGECAYGGLVSKDKIIPIYPHHPKGSAEYSSLNFSWYSIRWIDQGKERLTNQAGDLEADQMPEDAAMGARYEDVHVVLQLRTKVGTSPVDLAECSSCIGLTSDIAYEGVWQNVLLACEDVHVVLLNSAPRPSLLT